MNKIFITVFLFSLSFSYSIHAQTPVWAFNIGSTTDDYSHVVKVAPNGNIYIGGKFTGTMDLDPGPGVHNVTSVGVDDMFLACYSPTGTFIWGFSIGGPNYDVIWRLNCDLNSNVIVTGWFQSAGVDFDPGPGVSVLPYAGGTGITTSGDGFIAKYSSTGTYMWAYDIGGITTYDHTENVDTDPNGNIYLSGEADDLFTIGPYSFSSGVNGQAYLVKYSPSGTVIWAHNFGLPGTTAADCQAWGLRYSNGNIYIGGIFQGTSNFDPWGPPAILTTVGYYDAYIAKYDTNGNYLWVKQIIGSGFVDQIIDLQLDASDNIYVTGNTNSATMTFDPASPGTTTVTAPGGGTTNDDIFMAKYDSNGVYKWGTILGGPGEDVGWCLDVVGGYLYATGEFSGTVDMDPSAGVANYVSTGGTDIYVTKYDLNGNYICGFSLGSPLTGDIGYGLSHDVSGNLFSSGQFGGSAVNFNPVGGSYPLTSIGGTDAYLVKYSMVGGAVYTGSMTGDTICGGQPAQLTITVTSGGPGPYTITYTDGTTTYTQTGVVSGVPFTLSPSPTVTTTYTIISIAGPGISACNAPSGAGFGSATVVVSPSPVISITPTNLSCNKILFTAIGADSIYAWSFGDGALGTGNPTIHTYSVTGTEVVSLTQTTKYNCSATGSVTVNILSAPAVNLGPDTTLCSGNTLTLGSLVTYTTSPTYLWSTGSTSPTITVTTSGTYWLAVTQGACTGTDTINVIFKPSPSVALGNDTAFCIGDTLTLSSMQPAGSTYMWNTGSTGSSIQVATSGTYWLNVTNSSLCGTTDTIHVLVSPKPVVDLGPDTTQCQGLAVTLQSSSTYSSPSYLWSTGSTASSITVTTGGIFWLAVTQGGCTGADTINVSIVTDTFTLITPDTAICRNHNIVPIRLTLNPAATVQWLPTAGIANPTSPDPTIQPDTSAEYHVYISVPGCPRLEDSLYIDVQPNPEVFAGGNRKVCQFDTIHIEAAVIPDWYTHYSYTWSPSSYLDNPGSPAVVFSSELDTKYILTVTTPAGCTSKDSLEVTVNPGEFATLDSNFTVCPHDSIQFVPSGGAFYQWHPGLYLNDSMSAAPWVHPITSQTYTVVAANQYGCLDTLNVHVTVEPAAVITLGSDSVHLFPGQSYQMDPQGNCVNFEWLPPSGLSNAMISNPIATPQLDVLYKVYGTTEWGCKTEDSIYVYLEPSVIAIPNAFTPGAGVNNELRIIVQGEATLSYFRIFNRWGNKVFETANIAQGWDGTYHGQPQPYDVYVYEVEAVTMEGKIVRKSGNVTLIR